jgi:FdhD protein
MSIAGDSTSKHREIGREPALAGIDLVRWPGCVGDQEAEKDQLVREEPLEIRIGGRSVAITMRTPGEDKELAIGFLVSEGLIRRRSDLVDVLLCRHGDARQWGNRLNILLKSDVALDFTTLTRHVFASSSCGLCGKSSIESIQQSFPPVTARFKVSAKTVAAMPHRMRAAQRIFDVTGGLHAAALFDLRGRLVALHEDVGRHNAVDKAIGSAFLAGRLPLTRQILLVSGRASFEILQKALAARIPFICAVSAPSTLAVEFARSNGQTLVGFLRGQGFNVYSRADRIRMNGVREAPAARPAPIPATSTATRRLRSKPGPVVTTRVVAGNRNGTRT